MRGWCGNSQAECLCENCARKVRHQRAGTRDYSSGQTSVTQQIRKDWPEHKRTGYCYVCCLLQQQSRGGPRASSLKPKRGHLTQVTDVVKLPFDCTSNNVFAHLSMPTSTTKQQVPPYLELLSHVEQSLFTCAICMCILSRPCVQTPCQHNYCAESVCLLQTSSSNSATRPSLRISQIDPLIVYHKWCIPDIRFLQVVV